jgi:3-methyladenine DNA glycosylase AlkC
MADLIRECINNKTIIDLASRINNCQPNFDDKGFSNRVTPQLSQLGLFERIEVIVTALKEYLPKDFSQAAEILTSSLGIELDDQGNDPVAADLSSSRGFIVVAVATYISRYGVNHFDLSMTALREMTKRFSSEGPIRDFLITDEKKVLALYQKWTEDDNVHVRRLVSESCRPRLPWARQLPSFIKDPQEVIALLEKLKSDQHLYVRRSVANNLNDISKDNPKIVIKTLTQWSTDKSAEMNWLVKHALRTLLKQGHPGALQILGFSTEFNLKAESFTLDKEIIKLGDSLEFFLELSSPQKEPQRLMIDYVIYHMKANGKLNPKVFKWTQKTISANGTLFLKKKQNFKKISTRKYYPGRHEIHLQINGTIVAKKEFILDIN